MENDVITPLILGTGSAGKAIAKSLAAAAIDRPELGLAPPVWLARGASLEAERKKYGSAVLCIANPHGLHAETILAAERAGFDGILCEKPTAVDAKEVEALRSVKTPTAVFQVYRQTWGLQTIGAWIREGKLGELIAVEGRYWQSSLAAWALTGGAKPPGWKDDPRFSGAYDVYLDLGVHWVDAASFLAGGAPTGMEAWRSYRNAPSAHRDTHVQAALTFASGARGLASFSKTVHGATNGFEIHAIGEKGAASWHFLNPDEITLGEGRDRRIVARDTSVYGSRQWPFHGLGWIEGYVEIAARLAGEITGQSRAGYPTLAESLDVLEAMFRAEW
jgi:predicted dehydrogenase